MLDDDYDVGAVLADLSRFGADTRRAKNHRVNLRAELVGEDSRGSDRLEPDFAEIRAPTFDECKDVRHQRSFASLCSSLTNS